MIDEFAAVLRAREFIQQAAIDSIPIDLDRYLDVIRARCKIVDDLDDEEAGQTTVIAGRHCIFVNGRHSPERQRFTVLHEVGHIVLGLPSGHEPKIGMQALYSYAVRPKEEILCDVFAAECLLPADFFKPDLDQSSVGFDSVAYLAARYQASLTSTGSRFAFLHDEPCAFVLIESGRVRYVSSSKLMREWGCWISIGIEVPPGSVAQQLLDGQIIDGPAEVEASLWLEKQRRGGPVLLEEARLLDRWNQALSLLWFEPGDDSEDTEEEDEPALEELDGILPWPSKKRRR
jgi:Zn-dependent peptidase ImmA (M78 family)